MRTSGTIRPPNLWALHLQIQPNMDGNYFFKIPSVLLTRAVVWVWFILQGSIGWGLGPQCGLVEVQGP